MRSTAPTLSLRDCRRLHMRKERQRTGLFLAEGIRHVTAALESPCPVELVLYAPDLLRGDHGDAVLDTARSRAIPCMRLTRSEFTSLSLRENPQGLACAGRQRWARLSDLDRVERASVVALYGPQDPGNVGTILRVCDATDVPGVILIGDAVDPFHPTALRAAMGATFSRHLARCDVADFVAWSRNQCRSIVGTSDRATVDYSAHSYTPPFVLLMGSERQGLPADLENLANTMVRIPMSGHVDSLNLAIATALVLYEARNQLQRGS